MDGGNCWKRSGWGEFGTRRGEARIVTMKRRETGVRRWVGSKFSDEGDNKKQSKGKGGWREKQKGARRTSSQPGDRVDWVMAVPGFMYFCNPIQRCCQDFLSLTCTPPSLYIYIYILLRRARVWSDGMDRGRPLSVASLWPTLNHEGSSHCWSTLYLYNILPGDLSSSVDHQPDKLSFILFYV